MHTIRWKIWRFILIWSRKNETPTYFREYWKLKFCVGGFKKILYSEESPLTNFISCAHDTSVASETPFVTRRLHFLFFHPEVKILTEIAFLCSRGKNEEPNTAYEDVKTFRVRLPKINKIIWGFWSSTTSS